MSGVWVATVDVGSRGDLRDPCAGPLGVFAGRLGLENAKLACIREHEEITDSPGCGLSFQDVCLALGGGDYEEYSVAEDRGVVWMIHWVEVTT